MTAKDLIATEDKLAALWNDGQIDSLLHLEGSVDGSFEQWMVDFFASNIKPTDWVCASHRCHFAFQLHGGKDLIEKVKEGKSMFLYGPRFLCSAIVAGTASIAVGLALAIQQRGGTERVYCFAGDAATEHGHWLEAVFYSWTKSLPICFIVTDNNSSCGVTKEQRRGSELELRLPENVVRVKYTPRFPHAGTGKPMTLKPKPIR